MVRRMMTAYCFEGMMRPLHQKIYRQEEREETRARRMQVRRACLFQGAGAGVNLQYPTNLAGDFVHKKYLKRNHSRDLYLASQIESRRGRSRLI